MNISLLANLLLHLECLLARLLGGNDVFFFSFLMEKCTTAEGFVFHNAEPILSMPVILISIRNLYAHKIDVRPNLPGYIVSCCFKLNLEQTGSHQKRRGRRKGKAQLEHYCWPEPGSWVNSVSLSHSRPFCAPFSQCTEV